MNVLLIYQFKDKEAFKILKHNIENFEGNVLYRSSNIFWIKCQYNLVYQLFHQIYISFKDCKVLDKSDRIEAFYISSISTDISMAILKKENNKKLRKLDFEFLETNNHICYD